MARKDALLRLHTRLVARRDALRKALSGEMDHREFAAMTDVGDNVDAAVDTANEEISSQLAEIESRELSQIEHALQRIVEEGLWTLRVLRREDRRGSCERTPLYELLYRLPARERAPRPSFRSWWGRTTLGQGLREADRRH